MKCPECQHDQKYKYGLKCGSCGYGFTFDKRSAVSRGLTDGKFLACVNAASQNGTVWFTSNQLFAAYSRRSYQSPVPSLIGVLIFLAAAIGVGMHGPVPIAVGLGVATLLCLSAFAGRVKSNRTTRTRAYFDRLVHLWRKDGKPIEKLIDEPSLHEPPPEWSEPDIYDYGVERLLIVERDVLVDLLVRNGIHAEQRALVISESGYPDYLLPVARRVLEEQPDVPIFLLHDATTRGAAMEDRVKSGNVLPVEAHQVIDLGMYPEDFRNLKRMKRVAPENEHRDLPVDSMLLPFMTMGLAAAMTDGIPLGMLIDQQRQQEMAEGSSDFG